MSWNPFSVGAHFEKIYERPKGRLSGRGDDTLVFRRWCRYLSLDGKYGEGSRKGNLSLSGEGSWLSVEWDSWCSTPKNQKQRISRQKTEIECGGEHSITPRKWSIEDRVYIEKALIEACNYTERGHAKDGKIKRVVDGMERPIVETFSSSRALTCDWLLMKQIPDVAKAGVTEMRFDQLEGMRVMKPNQTLRYHGQHLASIGDYEMNLHQYRQTGPGSMPTDYWLDDNFRPLFVITGAVYLYHLTAVKENESSI